MPPPAPASLPEIRASITSRSLWPTQETPPPVLSDQSADSPLPVPPWRVSPSTRTRSRSSAIVRTELLWAASSTTAPVPPRPTSSRSWVAWTVAYQVPAQSESLPSSVGSDPDGGVGGAKGERRGEVGPAAIRRGPPGRGPRLVRLGIAVVVPTVAGLGCAGVHRCVVVVAVRVEERPREEIVRGVPAGHLALALSPAVLVAVQVPERAGAGVPVRVVLVDSAVAVVVSAAADLGGARVRARVVVVAVRADVRVGHRPVAGVLACEDRVASTDP